MTPESDENRDPKPVLLVVDDEEGVRSSLELVFSDQFEVVTAQNGPEALEKIGSLAPNLMMLDLKLPEMHGLEVLERAKIADSALEVIVITALHELETAVEAMRLGAFTYVVKPFDNHQLRDLAKRALTKHRINLDNSRVVETLMHENSRLRVQRNRLRRRLHVAEEALHSTREELLHAARFVAIGEVAANLAHEIRNPLTVMASYAQLIRANQERSIEPYVEKIEHTIRRLMRLTQHLMRLGSPVTHYAMLYDVNQMVEDALALVRPRTDIQKLAVVTHLETPTPRLNGDPDQMVQLLLNLFLNACQAMPNGGELEVTTASLTDPDDAPGRWVEIAVRDTGVGIAPEVLSRIFEPYFTTKGRSEGTGLGLAVVHKIVEGLGGNITVSSELGAGSRFRIRLLRSLRTTLPPDKKEAAPPSPPQ
jgi:signal transduction histidine kinase